MTDTPLKMVNDGDSTHQNERSGEQHSRQNENTDYRQQIETVSILEAVELTGLSESTIRRRIKHKKIVAWQINTMRGPEWHIPLTEIERLKAEKTQKSIVKRAKLGGDLVGMTSVPEVVLAREAEMCYASISLVTNFAAGISPNPLTHEEVVEMMTTKSEQLKNLIAKTIENLDPDRSCWCQRAVSGQSQLGK